VDYFQGVVTDYLRASRSVFVNTECCIQLNLAPIPTRADYTGTAMLSLLISANLRFIYARYLIRSHYRRCSRDSMAGMRIGLCCAQL
jgi:hypothetical protein